MALCDYSRLRSQQLPRLRPVLPGPGVAGAGSPETLMRQPACVCYVKIPGYGKVPVPPSHRVLWSSMNRSWFVIWFSRLLKQEKLLRVVSNPDELYRYLSVDLARYYDLVPGYPKPRAPGSN